LREHKEPQVKFSFEIAELLNPGIMDNIPNAKPLDNCDLKQTINR